MTTHKLRMLCHLLAGVSLLLTSLPVQAGKVTRYVHTDHLGSPAVKTDSTGAEMWRQSHSPYGEDEQGPTPDGPGYTGHRNDAATGLVYMQARYYDPQIGQFLSVDPVTFSADKPAYFNRYWYAAGNPYKYTDPDGRCYAPPVAVGCAAVGGLAILGLGIYKYNTDPNAKAGIDGLGQAIADAASEVGNTVFNESKTDDTSNDEWKGDNPRETKGRVNTDRTSDPDKDWAEEFGGTAEVKDDGTKVSPNGERFREGKDGQGPRIDIPAESSGNSKHETIHYPPRSE